MGHDLIRNFNDLRIKESSRKKREWKKMYRERQKRGEETSREKVIPTKMSIWRVKRTRKYKITPEKMSFQAVERSLCQIVREKRWHRLGKREIRVGK